MQKIALTPKGDKNTFTLKEVLALPKINYKENLCKACCLCIEFCPTKAISLSDTLNERGYQILRFDEDLCISCGNCYRMCPDLAISLERRLKNETRLNERK